MRMSDPDPELHVFPEEAPDPAVVRAERRLERLQELAGIGMELARALKPDDAKEASVYAPLSRAIRLTLMLEAKFDEALRDLKAGVEAVRKEARAKAAAQDVEAREEKVRDLVLTAAERECETSETFRDVELALEERLEQDEAYADHLARPLRQTIERLCKDLKLSPDWSRWDGEGWAREDLPARPLFSSFHEPSAKPVNELFAAAFDAGPLGRPPFAHALE
jgi:hypothetical protein